MRRLEITAFRQERIVSHSVVTICPICHSHSELLTPAQAAAVAQVGVRSIYRWLADNKMHGAVTPGRDRRICKNSLFLVG